MSKFGQLKNKKKEMKIVLLVDKLQELKTNKRRIFQLYFYKNLFEPSAHSKIINNESLTKQTVIINVYSNNNTA